MQISILLAVWAGMTVILEIPSGVLADRYSRKNLLIIGRFFKAAAFVMWLGGTFWHYAAGFCLWSVSSALFSGTFLIISGVIMVVIKRP